MNTSARYAGLDPETATPSLVPLGCAAQRTGPPLPPQGRYAIGSADGLRPPLTREPPRPLGQKLLAGQGTARAGARHTQTTSVQRDQSLHGFRD